MEDLEAYIIINTEIYTIYLEEMMIMTFPGLNSENIIILLIAMVILYFAFKFLKGVLRFVISLILIFTLGISLYNIFIAQKPLSYEVNRYKVDIAYFKEMGSINKEVYEVIKEIKADKDIPKNVENLQKLEKQAEALKHSEESNIIHNQYISNLKKLVLASQAYKSANGSKEYLDNLNQMADKINISLKEVLFPK